MRNVLDTMGRQGQHNVPFITTTFRHGHHADIKSPSFRARDFRAAAAAGGGLVPHKLAGLTTMFSMMMILFCCCRLLVFFSLLVKTRVCAVLARARKRSKHFVFTIAVFAITRLSPSVADAQTHTLGGRGLCTSFMVIVTAPVNRCVATGGMMMTAYKGAHTMLSRLVLNWMRIWTGLLIPVVRLHKIWFSPSHP